MHECCCCPLQADAAPSRLLLLPPAGCCCPLQAPAVPLLLYPVIICRNTYFPTDATWIIHEFVYMHSILDQWGIRWWLFSTLRNPSPSDKNLIAPELSWHINDISRCHNLQRGDWIARLLETSLKTFLDCYYVRHRLVPLSCWCGQVCIFSKTYPTGIPCIACYNYTTWKLSTTARPGGFLSRNNYLWN